MTLFSVLQFVLMVIGFTETRKFQLPIGFCMGALAVWIILVEHFLLPLRQGMHEAEQKFRARRGRCLNCGYSLRGNTSGVCPECGKRTAIATPKRS